MLTETQIIEIWSLPHRLDLRAISGTVNRVAWCRNNGIIIKEYDRRFTPQNVMNSVVAQDHFAQLGWAAPIRKTMSGAFYLNDNTFYVASQYVRGSHLTIDEIDRDRLHRLGCQLGRYHRAFDQIKHEIELVCNITPIPDTTETLASFDSLFSTNKSRQLQQQWALYYSFLKRNENIAFHQNELIHGDMRLENILVRSADDQYLLLDFDQVSHINRVYEIMRFFLCLVHLTTADQFCRELRTFLSAYEYVWPIAPQERRWLLKLYFYCMLSNLRCFDHQYVVKANDEFIESRLKKMKWIHKNFDAIHALMHDFTEGGH